MAYKPESDVLIKSIGRTESGILVEIRSYDGGPEKVTLKKERNGGGRTYNVNRMSDEELSDVLPLLNEAEDYFARR